MTLSHQETTTDSDRALVSAYVAGDMRAFTVIVERHRARLLWVARRYARNEDDAHDILQEALLKASRKLHTYRAESTLSTWLHRLVMNSGWDFAHHRSHREQTTLDDDVVPHEFNIRLSYDPTRHLDQTMLLRQAMAKLRPDQRAALLLIDVAGYSVSHVARREGVRPGTIKSRRARAREFLREDLRVEPA
ncbi:sigma-70 family RNA polymerase sigma factor [Corynebacterium halotolerans]|uniref:RNA polymerase sigma factor n=1 Tax=Corynebacterium halotolerans YIM 70093 = DSM 44683 TaxID=1121362 RepID=M1NWD1_9CORY|nr:sigma-70 family RNA polymerase sigma factor [Corynebacterium halotolerans]AGF73797.1 RNA polymerase sigma factor [Corynebacterium halotolerans YIM 70093 = DSM 44683]